MNFEGNLYYQINSPWWSSANTSTPKAYGYLNDMYHSSDKYNLSTYLFRHGRFDGTLWIFGKTLGSFGGFIGRLLQLA